MLNDTGGRVADPETVGATPDVTLILATYLNSGSIAETLASVGRQTLDPTRFELLIIENGPPCGTTEIVRRWRERNPTIQVREAPVHVPGLSHARNLALSLARGTHVTYIDDDDVITPTFLEALVEAARPGVIPTALIVDVAEGIDFTSVQTDRADLDNYYSNALSPHAGDVVFAERVSEALSVNAAKMIPTSLARAIQYREHLRSGEDFVYWTEVFARTESCLSVLPTSAAAYYLRRVRAGSMSRKDLSYDFSVTQRLECMSALDDVPTSSPVARRVLQGKVNAQSTHLRNYLIQHPEERQRVVDDIEVRGLEMFDFQTITRGLARDLAILYCFAPHQDTSAMVSMRRLRERGAVVDVVSNELDKVRRRDEWSSRAAAGFVDENRVLRGPQGFSSWMPIRQFMADAQPVIEQMQQAKGNYRSIYSRSAWPASHFAAALFKVRNPGVHWRAEFSDPQARDIFGETKPDTITPCDLVSELETALSRTGFAAPEGRRTFEWCEWLPYVLADQVLFTNANQREYMLGYCADPGLAELVRGKSEVEHHPTLPRQFYDVEESTYTLDPSVRHIAYFGVFYATRGLVEVSEAFAQLPQSARRRLRLHVFTDKPDVVAADVAEADLTDVIKVSEYRPFLEFLNLSTKFDALLVNDARTADRLPTNPYLPSKLSDYLGSGTPIWSIVEPGSILSDVPTKYQSRLGDVHGATRVLTEIATS